MTRTITPLRSEKAVDDLEDALSHDFEAVLGHLRAGRELMDRLERVTAGVAGGSVLRGQGKALDQMLATLEEEAGAACERISPASRPTPPDPRPKRQRPRPQGLPTGIAARPTPKNPDEEE